MVGLDAITSVSRYTLEPVLGSENVLFLWDGLSLVAVTVGLFAIPEIIELGTQGSSIARDTPGALGGVMQGSGTLSGSGSWCSAAAPSAPISG